MDPELAQNLDEIIHLPGCILVLAATAALTLAGCASTAPTPAQQQWMTARDQQPLTFIVPAEEADAAWSRAQEWIVRHAEHPLITATDTLLQTAVGQDDFDASVSLTVNRARLEDGSWRFDIVARTGNPLSGNRTWRVARALAYYTASGIPYPAP